MSLVEVMIERPLAAEVRLHNVLLKLKSQGAGRMSFELSTEPPKLFTPASRVTAKLS